MYKKFKKYLLSAICLLLAFLLKIDALEYESYSIGDVVTYNGMNFYVIEDSDENSNYVTVLKDVPLTIYEVNEYGAGYLNKYTLSSVGTAYNLGKYGGIAYYSSETCRYLETHKEADRSGCNIKYDESDIKKVVDNWQEGKISDDDLVVDEFGYKVRLISYEDLKENFDFVQAQGVSYAETSLQSLPEWLDGKISYWTMSNYDDSNYLIYAMYYYGGTGTTILNATSMYGNSGVVRPVVNFLKSSIQKKANNNNEGMVTKKKLTDEEFKIGDIVEYNGIDFYVIKDSSKADPTVTLLKAEPLKTDEMKSLIKSTEVSSIVSVSGEYLYIPFLVNDTCASAGVGDISGCTTNYSLSIIKQIVDIWSKAKLTDSDLIEDEYGNKARLLSYEDLINNLGCIRQDGADYMYDSPVTPDWIHIENNYFTMSQYDDSNINVWKVSFNEVVQGSVFNGGAIRPVITLKKQNYNSKNNQIVSVPDTFLNKPIIWIIVGVILIIIGGILGYLIIKTKKYR